MDAVLKEPTGNLRFSLGGYPEFDTRTRAIIPTTDYTNSLALGLTNNGPPTLRTIAHNHELAPPAKNKHTHTKKTKTKTKHGTQKRGVL